MINFVYLSSTQSMIKHPKTLLRGGILICFPQVSYYSYNFIKIELLKIIKFEFIS